MAGSDNGLGLSPEELAVVLNYIDANLAKPALCTELAERLAMSRSKFNRLFKESTGQTPYAFVLARRVARARELLAWTEQPIDDVGRQVGFTRHANFSTIFRRYAGITPMRFRVAKRMASNLNRKPTDYLRKFGGDLDDFSSPE